MDRRLWQRYAILVTNHMRATNPLATGNAGLSGGGECLAATQAAYRFYNNDDVTLPTLIEPLRACARRATQRSDSPFLLLVHDWSKLKLGQNRRRTDELQLTHDKDVGYELYAALLVDPEQGRPIAPLELQLTTANEVFSTRLPAPSAVNHVDQVLGTMQAARGWNLPRELVHVIDREADSLGHFRAWDAAGHRFLVRADDRRVLWQEKSRLGSEIAMQLRSQPEVWRQGKALHQGHSANLLVAETTVILAGRHTRREGGKQREIAGPPLTLRLTLADLRDAAGQLLASWALLSNVPLAWATAWKLAECYYYRWQIECYFKLLKSHGQQVETWRQQTGAAVARRLLIAAMACAQVCRVAADPTSDGEVLRALWIKLSGRQLKRGRGFTLPALLAGAWVHFALLAALQHVTPEELKRLASQATLFPSGFV